MEFRQTISRHELLGMRDKHKMAFIVQCIENLSHGVLHAARSGETRHMIEVRNERATGWTGEQYVPTNEDLIEGFRAKFPGCNVQYEESWVTLPRTPNQMHKKSGIIVDWS